MSPHDTCHDMRHRKMTPPAQPLALPDHAREHISIHIPAAHIAAFFSRLFPCGTQITARCPVRSAPKASD
jgi:hypothetical protein